VDVSQDVIINEEDCGTLRGLVATAIKKNEEVVETLYERILGRTTVHNVYHPLTGELIVESGQELTEELARKIEDSPIEQVEIRSVLTCESKKGVCAKCYGRNLSTVSWFRKVKLPVLLQPRVSANREHSLHFVHSTLEVLHQTLQPNQA